MSGKKEWAGFFEAVDTPMHIMLSLCRIKKQSSERIQNCEIHHFRVYSCLYGPNKNFPEKPFNVILLTSWPLSMHKILKKFSGQIQKKFFQKPINKLSFHSCISTSKKSKSDVNPLMKYL